MSQSVATDVAQFMLDVERRNPNEPEFLQAVREVAESVFPFVRENQKYVDARILERMTGDRETIWLAVVPYLDPSMPEWKPKERPVDS